MYTNSEGVSVDVTTLETTHLINALSKKFREIFDSKDYQEYHSKSMEIEALKQELYKRINKFAESLGE